MALTLRCGDTAVTGSRHPFPIVRLRGSGNADEYISWSPKSSCRPESEALINASARIVSKRAGSEKPESPPFGWADPPAKGGLSQFSFRHEPSEQPKIWPASLFVVFVRILRCFASSEHEHDFLEASRFVQRSWEGAWLFRTRTHQALEMCQRAVYLVGICVETCACARFSSFSALAPAHYAKRQPDIDICLLSRSDTTPVFAGVYRSWPIQTHTGTYFWNFLTMGNKCRNVETIEKRFLIKRNYLHYQYYFEVFWVSLYHTAWCREIGSLTSLDACNSGEFRDVRESMSLHQAVRIWNQLFD